MKRIEFKKEKELIAGWAGWGSEKIESGNPEYFALDFLCCSKDTRNLMEKENKGFNGDYPLVHISDIHKIGFSVSKYEMENRDKKGLCWVDLENVRPYLPTGYGGHRAPFPAMIECIEKVIDEVNEIEKNICLLQIESSVTTNYRHFINTSLNGVYSSAPEEHKEKVELLNKTVLGEWFKFEIETEYVSRNKAWFYVMGYSSRSE